jgi:hypothetical protein
MMRDVRLLEAGKVAVKKRRCCPSTTSSGSPADTWCALSADGIHRTAAVGAALLVPALYVVLVIAYLALPR